MDFDTNIVVYSLYLFFLPIYLSSTITDQPKPSKICIFECIIHFHDFKIFETICMQCVCECVAKTVKGKALLRLQEEEKDKAQVQAIIAWVDKHRVKQCNLMNGVGKCVMPINCMVGVAR